MADHLLELARAGDHDAFEQLVDPLRRELHVHCYRLLGSFDDADDVLQDSLLAAWRGLPDFRGGSSIRTWLYRITTNRCLNERRDRARRPVPAPVPPFEPPTPTRTSDVPWLQPYPDARLGQVGTAGPEVHADATCTIQLSFVAALQRMPPRQAAVLIFSDVLGFPRAETARILDISPVAVKSALQRARTATHGTGPCAASRRADADVAIARRFAAAFAADDIDAVVAILSDDAWLTMPPAPHEYQGRAAIAAFLRASRAWRGSRRYRLVPESANHSPAFALHLDDDGTTSPAGLVVLEIHAERLVGITRFLSTTPLPPAELGSTTRSFPSTAR